MITSEKNHQWLREWGILLLLFLGIGWLTDNYAGAALLYRSLLLALLAKMLVDICALVLQNILVIPLEWWLGIIARLEPLLAHVFDERDNQPN